MQFLTKQQIIEAQDRRYAEVDVPEWGGKVRLTSLTADQQMKHEQMVKKGDTKVNPLTSMLAASIVDEKGELIFNEKDMAELGKKSPKVLVRLLAAMKELNKNDEDDKKGNSEANPTDDSPSDSV